MKRIISYFIKYPITGDVLILLILIFGVLGIFSMRSTFFPESESRLIVAQVVYPGASPEEVEEGIVAKIEDNLKGVTGIDRITSVSSENTGRVTVEGSRGYDVEVLLQDVKNAVDQINSFPVGIESPTIFKQEALTVALNFAISGNVDLQTLKRFARQIESDLLAKDGISKVSLNGFPEEEIEIGVREADLQTYGLSFDQVLRAVQAANLELTGGTIKTDVEELLIRSRNKEYYADDLLDVLVATAPDGRKVYLREVAEVRDKWVDTPNRLYVNGKPGVGINVSNTIDENLLDISTLVREHIAEFNERNDNIQAVIINDGSDVLNQRIDLLLNNGMVGIALVLLLLAMFLQVRLAFWVAIAIPISILGQFIIAPVIGVSINVLSLFGLILVIGILVDDGIVISENIYRHFEMGKDRMQAAIDGTMEVLPAVFSAILTTVVAFGSFLFLAGISGDFFSEMAIVVMLTLVFSLIEGAFILPGHVAHSKALTRKGEGEEVQKDQPESTFGMIVAGISGWFTRIQQYLWDFMEWMKNSLYAPFLRFFLRNPFMGLAVPLAILIFCFGLVGGGLVGVTFFPNIEANFVSTNLKMPSGVREAETQKWLDHIEAAIIRVNEDVAENRNGGKDIVTIITKNLGPAANEGSVLINLVDSENRPIKASEFSELVRKEVGTIYGAESFTIGAATPFGKAVSVALIGNQLSELDKAVNDLKAELSELADVRDITDTNQEGLREINVSLTDKARLLGLNLQTVIGQVRQGFFGAEIQRLQRGQDEVKVWVRYDAAERSSIGDLENMRIRTQTGQSIPLKELATLSVSRGVISINRLEGKREIRVEADMASDDASASAMIQTIETELLPPILSKYPSVSYSFEGQYRENAKTQASSGTVMPLVLILIFFIIMLTFRSLGQTLTVFSIIPFGLIGVILGHLIFNQQISVLSFLGVFALIGVLVNDALVFVSAHNILIKEGKPFREAIYEAGLSRFRPIFLTSLTTIAGLGPLIFEKSFQAQFLIPMAISIAFGLAIATLVILITLPSIMVLVNQYKVAMVHLWEGEKPDPTSVEPALLERKNYLVLWLGGPVVLGALIFFLTSLF